MSVDLMVVDGTVDLEYCYMALLCERSRCPYQTPKGGHWTSMSVHLRYVWLLSRSTRDPGHQD
jgi:hypothetical protein